MKKIFLVIFTLALTGMLFTVNAQNKPAKKEAVKKETVKPSAEKKVFNKFCPIMGEEVDAKVQTVDYNGKTIGFCCKKCVKKFSADPEKYMKHLSADGQKYIK